jgi:hypothetical protein
MKDREVVKGRKRLEKSSDDERRAVQGGDRQ